MFNNANILVTGGTGSFGKCCIKLLLERYKPNKIILFSRDELKQFEMQNEMHDPQNRLRYFIGDIRDRARLTRALHGIDYVIHAAALKQVPALEYNPDEAVKTNILGAQNMIEACLEAKVKKVVALSTDKAVSPVNLYGATKLVADKLFSAANNIRGLEGTKFSIVRYGNVLSSRGSVVPFFRDLVAKGVKQLPITDERMTRFFLTLPQAVEFVFNSFKHMHGGEIFTPKIPSFRITDLAEAVAGHRNFKVIGIRPGEKLHEVLCPRDLSSRIIEFKDFYIIEPVYNLSGEFQYHKTAVGEEGKNVPEDFEYDSLTNPDFISVPQIKKLIETV